MKDNHYGNEPIGTIKAIEYDNEEVVIKRAFDGTWRGARVDEGGDPKRAGQMLRGQQGTGGISNKTKEFKRLCRDVSTEYFHYIDDIFRDPNTPLKFRIDIYKHVISYAHGLPKADEEGVTREELMEILPKIITNGPRE